METSIIVIVAGLYGAWLLVSFVVSLVVNYQHEVRASRMGCKAPPTLSSLPFGLDFMFRLIRAASVGCLPHLTLQLYSDMGAGQQGATYLQNFFGRKGIATVDPKNIQAVLAVQFQDFALGETRRGNFSALLGNGIFTNDGKAWEHSRAMLRPQFARGQFADLRNEEHHLQYFFLHLPKDASQAVNLRPLFQHLVLDNATEFLCGESVHSLINSLPDNEYRTLKAQQGKQGGMDWTRFAEYFDEATKALGVRVRLFDRYWLYQPPSFHRACRQVHAYADCQVDNALRSQKSQANAANKQEKFVFLNELIHETQDRIELRSQLLNVLLAGRDTIAGMLSWTFYLLARYPDKYAELRTAVLREFGTYNQPRDFSFTSLKSCQYLQWVLMEVLRLYPAVPVNSRRATRDTSIPRGGGPDGNWPVYVRKGQEVNYYVYAMHRRPDLWGPDAHLFRPERWENRKHGWEYLPFNGGPRICLGQQYALTEGAYVLARMVQRYQAVENADPDPVDRHDYQLTSAPTRVLVRLVEDKNVLQEAKIVS